MTNIYILRLQDNKYYVGKSDDPYKRYQEHCNGYGSFWTNKYRPIEIEKIIKDANSFDEDRYVKEYMSKYGIENVRGGTYVTEELVMIQKEMLTKEIRGANDCCIRCGFKGHFIKNCYAKTDVNGNRIEKDNSICDKLLSIGIKLFSKIDAQNYSDTSFGSVPFGDTCYRCGRYGHWANKCYAKTDSNGNRI